MAKTDKKTPSVPASGPNPKVDFYFNKNERWKGEIARLRKILLGCGLTEELKWGVPCYSLEGSNIVLIHVFKEYCALLFFKGVLMKDPKGLLIIQTENVQVARQIRFTRVEDIAGKEKTLVAYVREAVAVERSGAKAPMKETSDFPVADELKRKLDADPALKAAFKALTPGRQRGYLMYFSQAKQARTREERVEKCVKKILAGKGMLDD
ncbi:MAG TPA: YdeI/OmpD-associated family protein [bacterium]|jgi:uncharacterized protein YdeI (YjbR/CyaY-like superfamily)|nr:YdeI/OmpD-associated family protein [bacterium]